MRLPRFLSLPITLLISLSIALAPIRQAQANPAALAPFIVAAPVVGGASGLAVSQTLLTSGAAVGITAAFYHLFVKTGVFNPSSCAPGEKYSNTLGCHAIVHIQNSLGYSPPVPPAPVEVLAPAVPAKYVVSNSSTVGPLHNLYIYDLNNVLSAINEQLTNSAYSTRPWYGKIVADGIVNSSGATVPVTGAGTYFIRYKITQDFTLNRCIRYTANSVISYSYQPNYSQSSQTDSFCIYNSGNSILLNGWSYLLSSGTTYGALTDSVLPFNFYFSAPSCNAGYTYDVQQNTCKLTDASLVKSAPDGICAITTSNSTTLVVNSFDPDCARLSSLNKLQLASNGASITVPSGDPDDANVEFNNKFIPLGDQNTLQAGYRNNATGVNQQFTYSADKSGVMNSYVAAPPTYSATPTSAAIAPTVVIPAPGTAAVQCGGAGMPPCTVALDATKELKIANACGGSGQQKCAVEVANACGGSGQGPCSVVVPGLIEAIYAAAPVIPEPEPVKNKTEEPIDFIDPTELNDPGATDADDILARVHAFSLFSLPAPNYSCYTAWDVGSSANASLNFFGSSIPVHLNLNEACPLVAPYESKIRALSLPLWYIAAILLFIRRTT